MSLDRDTLVRRSLNKAGLLDAAAPEIPEGYEDQAVDALTVELDALQEQGIVLQNVDRATLAIVAGTKEYTLPADTLNVFIGPDNLAGTMVDSDDNESPVRAISRHQYVTGILNKEAEAGTATHVYVEKTSVVKVVFWPEPTDTATFRYQKVRLNETMETFGRWQKYLLYAMAASLAADNSRPEDVISRLDKRASAERALAKGSDQELGPQQLYVPRYWGGR